MFFNSTGIHEIKFRIPGMVQQPLSEQSLVGFGSQIAREILNPGSYQREQEASTNTFMARVAEAKAQAKAAETAKQQVNTSYLFPLHPKADYACYSLGINSNNECET